MAPGISRCCRYGLLDFLWGFSLSIGDTGFDRDDAMFAFLWIMAAVKPSPARSEVIICASEGEV